MNICTYFGKNVFQNCMSDLEHIYFDKFLWIRCIFGHLDIFHRALFCCLNGFLMGNSYFRIGELRSYIIGLLNMHLCIYLKFYCIVALLDTRDIFLSYCYNKCHQDMSNFHIFWSWCYKFNQLHIIYHRLSLYYYIMCLVDIHWHIVWL